MNRTAFREIEGWAATEAPFPAPELRCRWFEHGDAQLFGVLVETTRRYSGAPSGHPERRYGAFTISRELAGDLARTASGADFLEDLVAGGHEVVP